METKKIERSVGVHDGSFHADEVTACSFLVLFNLVDRTKIFRTRDPLLLKQCEYVCDVGGEYNPQQKLFDHHQVEYTGPLSSAGMILQYLLDAKIIEPSIYQLFNEKFVIGVDDHDNGRASPRKGYATFSHIISNFSPIRYDCTQEDQDKGFNEALDFVIRHNKSLLERHYYFMGTRDIVEETMKLHKECLFFDCALPWLENFFELGGEEHPALFVLMPTGEHWKLRGIPPTYDRRMEVRRPLPLQWAGLLDQELKQVSRVPGAIFCHKGRFISIWETKEDAIKALNYVLKRG